MLTKLCDQIRRYDMVSPGDKVICAVSGGADSMALLWAMYLLKEKLDISLEVVHFNHGLRGAESDRDEEFVRNFCAGYHLVCHTGKETVVSGKKGLEAAARAARYAYFATLSGKIATAHTADDNAETVLMHLVRGTGLKGLGGITPVNGNVIRPMLGVTRQDVLAFLEEYHIPYINDSSNETDAFLRNRLRHHVMPFLKKENPRLAENLSAMAMELRQDEAALQRNVTIAQELNVSELQQMEQSLRRRTLAAFLQSCGVKEPERAHIALAESLVFSQKPSAVADFPGNVRIRRSYDALVAVDWNDFQINAQLGENDCVEIPELGIRVVSSTCVNNEAEAGFLVSPVGQMVLRSRQAGDKMRLHGGTKSLKKLFIDRKIPEYRRNGMVVIADDAGVLGVYGIGPNLDRIASVGVQIRFEEI